MALPITVTCECGAVTSTRLGETVTCSCGKRYDTATLPPERFANAAHRRARARLYTQLSMIFVIGASVLSAVFWGMRGLAVVLPVAGLIWFIFLGRWYRKRWLRDVYRAAETTTLDAAER